MCACAYAYLRSVHPTRVGARLIALMVLAQVHLIAIAMAGVLLFMEFIERPLTRRSIWEWVGTIGVLASIGAGLWQLIPPGHNNPSLHATTQQLVDGIGEGFIPMLNGLTVSAERAQWGLVLWGLAAVVLATRAGWRALVGFVLLSASLLTICSQVYPGYRWHHGFYFFDFILSIWVWGPRVNETYAKYYVTALLGLHAALGLYAVGLDFGHPYSNGKAVAERIVSEHLQDYPLVVVEENWDGRDFYSWAPDDGQAVLAYLSNKPLFDPPSGRYQYFFTQYSNWYYKYYQGTSQLDAALQRISAVTNSNVVVVVMVVHKRHRARPISLQSVATFPPALDFGEHFEALQVRLRPLPLDSVIARERPRQLGQERQSVTGGRQLRTTARAQIVFAIRRQHAAFGVGHEATLGRTVRQAERVTYLVHRDLGQTLARLQRIVRAPAARETTK